MKKSILLWLFALALISELVFLSNHDLITFRIFTKPLLVGLLLIYFLIHSSEKKTRWLISIALVFSLIGDILLLFTERSELFFISGLISFLLAHVFYCIQFSRKRNKALNVGRPLFPLMALGAIFFYVLRDDLGPMLPPVLIYMLVILLMAFFAFLRKGKVSDPSYVLVATGALLFLLSDGILAIDKFRSPIPMGGVFIMATYGLAQLLIVLGVLREETRPPRVP